jgi:LacI family transcriptional regulator
MRQKTGYAPPSGYRTRRKTSNVILVLLPDFRHTYYDSMLRQLTDCAARHGKQLVILPLDERDRRSCLKAVDLYAPTGIILLDEQAQDPLADELDRRGVPVMACGSRALSRRFSSVRVDDFSAAYEGMNYLFSLGHRSIAVLSDVTESVSSGSQRLAGCQKAAADAGLTLPQRAVVANGTTFELGYAGMGTLLSDFPELTAVFAFSDDLAAGAIARLADAGFAVPGDVSVLGFDDSFLAECIRPRLTTVHQPIAQIAEYTLERLLAMNGAWDVSTNTLPCRVVRRESCRELPGAEGGGQPAASRKLPAT